MSESKDVSGAQLVTIRDEGADVAIVFVHGFGGDATETWGEFPQLLCAADALQGWDVYALGYASALAPDFKGIWEGDPAIPELAKYLRTRLRQAPLADKKQVALIAHSMGGLVCQRALVEFADVAAKTSHLLLYGTPSGGLESADGLFARLFKRQSRDMGTKSDFIADLRKRWTESFDNERPFEFRAVGGDRDEFVPASSSLACFDPKDCAVVSGNHLEIVKPADADSMSVKEAVAVLLGTAAPRGKWSAAELALERGEFRAVIDQLDSQADQGLGPSHLRKLALALDAEGQRDRAIEVLKKAGKLGTDATGILAGRHKRAWLQTGLAAEAKTALSLYQEAYDRADADDDHPQALYHGINIAFMKLVYEEKAAAAKEVADAVLAHCAKADVDHWQAATRGEAHLYLGDVEKAFAAYREAVEMEPTPRELESMYSQAGLVAAVRGDEANATELEKIFRG